MGNPIPILLLGMGLAMTISFRGKFILSIKFMWKNTLGLLFRKDSTNNKGGGTISSWGSGMTALASTIGTGNIAGVATAITMGGPGAVVWMWVSGLLGVSTKASEIILGQRYRIRYKSHDEFECDRPFVMRDAMGWKTGALLIAVFCSSVWPLEQPDTERGSGKLLPRCIWSSQVDYPGYHGYYSSDSYAGQA